MPKNNIIISLILVITSALIYVGLDNPAKAFSSTDYNKSLSNPLRSSDWNRLSIDFLPTIDTYVGTEHIREIATSTKLLINGGTDSGEIKLTNNNFTSSNPHWGMYADTGNNFHIWGGSVGTNALTINNNGYIGIGTNTPGTLLDVNGIIRSTNYFASAGTTGLPSYMFNVVIGSTGMYAPAVNELGFVTNGGERLRINSSGNVGIGVVNPSVKLEVNGNITASGKICDSVGCIGLAGGDWTKLGNDLYTTTLSGNVGIGKNNPQAKLDVNGGIKIGTMATACNSSASGIIRYNTTKKNVEFCNGTYWVPFGIFGGSYRFNCTSYAANSLTGAGCSCMNGYTGTAVGKTQNGGSTYYTCFKNP